MLREAVRAVGNDHTDQGQRHTQGGTDVEYAVRAERLQDEISRVLARGSKRVRPNGNPVGPSARGTAAARDPVATRWLPLELCGLTVTSPASHRNRYAGTLRTISMHNCAVEQGAPGDRWPQPAYEVRRASHETARTAAGALSELGVSWRRASVFPCPAFRHAGRNRSSSRAASRHSSDKASPARGAGARSAKVEHTLYVEKQ